MARRRARYTKLDPCKISIPKLKRLSPDTLMKTWSRLNHTKFGRTRAGSALVGWLANYSTAKAIREHGLSYYAEDPVTQRKHALRVYLKIARKLEKDFKRARSKACPVR